jgi:predicted porin
MKKLLLGTSALVAAGLFSNGALAQTATTDTPVQFKIGGQYYAGVGAFVQQDDQPGEVAFKRNPVSVQDYFLIRFIGSTTFSNGITAGVWTRLNAFSAPSGGVNTSSGFQSANNTTIKDSYLYLKNAATWGEFRLGDDSDVRRSVATGNNAGAANGDGNLGANSAAIAWLNTPVFNFTTLNLDGRGTKAVYYSPTIAGFQFGASFTPDKGGGHTNGPGNIGDNSGQTDQLTNGLTASLLNGNTAYNYWSLSGQWTGTIGPVKVVGTVGYSTGSRKNGYSTGAGIQKVALGQNVPQPDLSLTSTNNANPQVYNAGFQVDYGPWELGADYEQTMAIPGGLFGNAPPQALTFTPAGLVATTITRTNEMNNKVVDVNLSYTVGAIRLGAEYSRGAFEGVTGAANVKRQAILDQVQVGATYTVGPGVALVGMVQEALYDAGGAYVPLAGSFSSATTGVAANNNVYAKNSNSTALIFETSIRF